MWDKLEKMFSLLWWKEDRLWGSISEREKKLELFGSFAAWSYMIVNVIILAAFILFYRDSPLKSNWAELFMLGILLMGIIDESIRLKFYGDGTKKRKWEKRDVSYEFEQDWYELDDRIVKRNIINLVIMSIIAVAVMVGYTIYIINVIRFGYFEWSFINWLLGKC